MEDILYEFVRELPLTARQVFYLMVSRYDYPKDEKAYERLCNLLNRARRGGFIEFEALRDDAASVMQAAHYADENGFYAYVRRLASGYERDKLARQEIDIRVHCEASGMMPQLARVCEPFSVPVYSCSGFDSLTAKHDLAHACHDTFTYEGKPTVIFHLGDLDPSGVSIYESMKEDVLAFLSRDVPHKDPEDVARFIRVALTPKQVRDYDLSTAPPKRTDGRSRRWKGMDTCQLEALPPNLLAELLAEKIEAVLDKDVLREDREAEDRERRRITRALPAGSEVA